MQQLTVVKLCYKTFQCVIIEYIYIYIYPEKVIKISLYTIELIAMEIVN